MKAPQTDRSDSPDPLSLSTIQGSSSAIHVILSRLKQLMDREIVYTLEKHAGINVADWRILYILAKSGPMPQKDLIATIVMEQSHASRALNALHKAGLVKVTRDRDDMRKWNYALSGEGRKVFRKIDPVMQKRRDFLDSALTEKEAGQLRDMATRVANRTLQILQEQKSNQTGGK